MKGEDIANQLKSLLPSLTNDFTDQISITSLTRSGTTVTAVTDTVHGLADEADTTIAGAKEPINITSLTRDGSTVTAICDVNHKLPDPDKLRKDDPFFVEIANSSPDDYNGTFKLTGTPGSTTFEYAITATPASPATTAGDLLLTDTFLYNGFKSITLIDTTSFSYEIENDNLQSPAQGTIVLHKNPRIDWAASLDNTVDDYTDRNESDDVPQVRLYVVVSDRE